MRFNSMSVKPVRMIRKTDSGALLMEQPASVSEALLSCFITSPSQGPAGQSVP